MVYEGKVNEMNLKREIWKMEKVEKVNFRKIVEEQEKVNDSMLTEKSLNWFQQKENLVRDTVDRKKTVMVFGYGRVSTVPQRYESKKEDRFVLRRHYD